MCPESRLRRIPLLSKRPRCPIDWSVLYHYVGKTPEMGRGHMNSLEDQKSRLTISMVDGSSDEDDDTDFISDHNFATTPAAKSLEGRLTDDVITLRIAQMELGSYMVFDFCQVVKTCLSQPSDKRTKNTLNAPLIFLPCNDVPESDTNRNNHWSLGVYRPSIRIITCYDSCNHLGVARRAEPAIKQTLSWLLKRDTQDVAWREMVRAKACRPFDLSS